MKEHEIPTPAMIVDVAVAENNIATIAKYCASHNLKVRPHIKTHKLAKFGAMQMKYGATGLTCAKVGEIEVMKTVCDDLLLAYPIVDSYRCNRMAEIAKEKTIRIASDNAFSVDAIAAAAQRAGSTIGILVDLDIGFHRTGVQTVEELVQLAQRVTSQKNLRLDGIFCFPGHVNQYSEAQLPELEKISALLQQAIEAFDKSGLNRSIVSGGNSPSALNSHLVPQYTEIRPGTSVYHDWNQAYSKYCRLEDCAARVTCTVTSDAVPGKVVLDAGNKTFSSDRLAKDQANGGYGHIVEYPDTRIVRLSEEHGEVDLSKCDKKPRVGDRVHVIPNHICVAVNLQNFVYLKDAQGNLEKVPVDARGTIV